MFDWIANFFRSTIRQLGAILCNWIYSLISWLYELFMTITKVNILSSEDVQPIYERITMILTIVMVFYITFEVVKYIVSPDTITDKEKGGGSVIKRMIIVIILIAFVPKIFTMAYDLQSRIINNQVIPKIIVGNTNSDYENFGGDFSANLLSLFYSVNEPACQAAKRDDCTVVKNVVPKNLENLRNKEKFNLIQGMNKYGTVMENGEENDVPIIDFDGIMAILVGGFVAYILVLYCIDLGTRYGQLLFLQIMAPVSIISYISPKKDNMFSKWTKQCITTYIDLFIRMAIINFILLIIDVLWSGYKSGSLFTGLGEVAPSLKVFTFIALVMGLLVFAKNAPKLLQDLVGNQGAASIGYGLGAKGRFEPGLNAVRKTWGGGNRVAGAVTGAAIGIGSAIKSRKDIGNHNKNRFTKGLSTAYSATKAATRGIKAGAGKGGNISKANAAARQSVQKDVDIADKGGTIIGHDALGGYYQQKSTDIQRKLNDFEARRKAKDSVASAVKEMKVMKTTMSYKEDWDQKGFGDASARTAVIKDIEKASRIYAVSSKDTAAQNTFKDKIKLAIDKVYTEAASLDNKVQNNIPLTADEQKIIDARNEALNNIYSNMEIGSTNWNIVENEIIEAKRISEGQAYKGKDAQGNPIDKSVPPKNADENQERSNLTEFAGDIGDVADAAGKEASDLKFKESTRKAQANAKENK